MKNNKKLTLVTCRHLLGMCGHPEAILGTAVPTPGNTLQAHVLMRYLAWTILHGRRRRERRPNGTKERIAVRDRAVTATVQEFRMNCHELNPMKVVVDRLKEVVYGTFKELLPLIDNSGGGGIPCTIDGWVFPSAPELMGYVVMKADGEVDYEPFAGRAGFPYSHEGVTGTYRPDGVGRCKRTGARVFYDWKGIGGSHPEVVKAEQVDAGYFYKDTVAKASGVPDGGVTFINTDARSFRDKFNAARRVDDGARRLTDVEIIRLRGAGYVDAHAVDVRTKNILCADAVPAFYSGEARDVTHSYKVGLQKLHDSYVVGRAWRPADGPRDPAPDPWDLAGSWERWERPPASEVEPPDAPLLEADMKNLLATPRV